MNPINKGGTLTASESRMLTIAAKQSSVNEYVTKWAQVLSRVNYGLVGRACPVRVADENEAKALGKIPAATNNTRILLNPSIADLFNQHGFKTGASILLGLNFHEVAHNLYSPSPSNSVLVNTLGEYAALNRIHMGRLHGICNIMEDQRIESLFVVGRRSVASHFTVMWHKLLGGTDPVGSYLSTIGRVYIPDAYRQQLRAAAVAAGASEQFLDDAKSLIQQYCSLNLYRVGPQKRAAELVYEMHLLLEKNGVTPPTPPDHGENPRNGQSSSKKSKDEEASADRAAEEVRKQFSEDPADADSDADDGEDADGEGEGDGSDADGDGGEDGNGADGAGDGEDGTDGDADGGAGSSTDPAEGDADGASGNGAGDGNLGEEGDGGDTAATGGSGAGRSTGERGDKSLDDIVEDLLNDSALIDEVGRLGDAVDAGDGGESGALEDGAAYFTGNLNPRAEDKIAAGNVIRTLKRLHADSGAEWERRQTSGKAINLIKFKDRQPWETNFFDRYDEGVLDEFEMEVVALVDVSGSMSGRMDSLSKTLWILRRAFKDIGARVTGISFDDVASLLFRPTDPVSPDVYAQYRAGGNTAPMGALLEAQRIFSKSAAKTKVLLVLTDGSWSDTTICDGLIHRMNENGVYTMLTYLSNYRIDLSQPSARHYCKVGVHITDPNDLVVLMEDFVKIKVAAARR